MRAFDFVLVTLITASLAAVIVVFKNDAMPYPQPNLAAHLEPPARKPKPWAGIWIHSSGTRRGALASIEKAHAERGGAPFHYVIGNGSETADGAVEEGTRWREQRAGRNPDVIEICLVGDIDREKPTRAQEKALQALLVRLCRERMIPASEIYAESEKKKGLACPGRFFDADGTRARVREALGK